MNIGTYEKEYKAIFQNRRINRKPGEVFVEDGVIVPEKWFSQRVRPLFLLKEAYGEKDDWSLVKQLMPLEKEYACGATWRKVTQCKAGYLRANAFRNHSGLHLIRFASWV